MERSARSSGLPAIQRTLDREGKAFEGLACQLHCPVKVARRRANRHLPDGLGASASAASLLCTFLS